MLTSILRYRQAIRARLSAIALREKAFLDQTRVDFPKAVLLTGLKMPKTQPLQRQVFTEHFRIAHLNFWRNVHPAYPAFRLPLHLLCAGFCGQIGGTTAQRIERRG